MPDLKIKRLDWLVHGMTEFTPEELGEMGIQAERPTLGLILDDRTILVPILRRDGELFAGEFGSLDMAPEENSLGVLCWDDPPPLDWVRGPREDC